MINMILNAIFLALRQIRRNIGRAILTMLGVIIGVAAVIIMINLGEGTQALIKESIDKLGSNLLMVHAPPHLNPDGGTKTRLFTEKEVEALGERIAGVKYVAGINSSFAVVKHGNKNVQTTVNGVSKDYLKTVDWKIVEGRTLDEDEFKSGQNSCLMGESVKNNLFPADVSPLGARVRIGNIVCDVVGVLDSKGQGGNGSDQDDVLIVPLKMFLREIKPTDSIYNIRVVMLSLEDSIDDKYASDQIKAILRHMRNIPDSVGNSFEILSTKEIKETVDKSVGTMTLFIGAVAGVSLLVGGIGIMNIMLVSVTERTKEIGTRLAIGALEKEVLLQFLVESATVSAIGGLIGIVLSFFATLFLADKMGIPFIFGAKITILAFVFSAVIGIGFGFLPARKASRLNPIDALRHE